MWLLQCKLMKIKLNYGRIMEAARALVALAENLSHGGSQPSLTPALGDLTTSSDFCEQICTSMMHIHTCRQSIHTYIHYISCFFGKAETLMGVFLKFKYEDNSLGRAIQKHIPRMLTRDVCHPNYLARRES